MQPNQQSSPPDQWQQPAPTPAAAPYQTPAEPGPAAAPVPPVQPTVAEVPVAVASVPTIESAEEPVPEAGITEEQPGPFDQDAVLLRWEGTEYLHHTRSAKWYILFALTVVVMVVLAVSILRSVTFAILIPVMAVALLMYVRRAPEVLQYTLSRKGLHINDKLYAYDLFKSFGVVSHGGNHSAVLIPRKRFQISQTIYFTEEIGEQLVDMLAARLPMKEISPDVIDRLLAKLHL